MLDVAGFRPALFLYDTRLTMVYVLGGPAHTYERIANVAHELRTSSIPLMGCIQMLELSLPPGDARAGAMSR